MTDYILCNFIFIEVIFLSLKIEMICRNTPVSFALTAWWREKTNKKTCFYVLDISADIYFRFVHMDSDIIAKYFILDEVPIYTM